jgi:hypothetical protein
MGMPFDSITKVELEGERGNILELERERGAIKAAA